MTREVTMALVEGVDAMRSRIDQLEAEVLSNKRRLDGQSIRVDGIEAEFRESYEPPSCLGVLEQIDQGIDDLTRAVERVSDVLEAKK